MSIINSIVFYWVWYKSMRRWAKYDLRFQSWVAALHTELIKKRTVAGLPPLRNKKDLEDLLRLFNTFVSPHSEYVDHLLTQNLSEHGDYIRTGKLRAIELEIIGDVISWQKGA
jgi:hypothetical protein